MKFTWRNNIGDLVAWNSSEVDVVDDELKEYLNQNARGLAKKWNFLFQ